MAVPGQLWVPPWGVTTPLTFLDESSILEKIEIITFEAFWAKIAKKWHFEHFWHFRQIKGAIGRRGHHLMSARPQKCQNGPILKLLCFNRDYGNLKCQEMSTLSTPLPDHPGPSLFSMTPRSQDTTQIELPPCFRHEVLKRSTLSTLTQTSSRPSHLRTTPEPPKPTKRDSHSPMSREPQNHSKQAISDSP